MKITIVICFLTFLQFRSFGQVPNDDCTTAMDFGVMPFSSTPACPNAVASYVGDLDDLTNVTPSTPYYSMTGCQGYSAMTTGLADDIWYKYRSIGNTIKVWIYGLDTVHVNFYHGTNCSNLLPSGCFTYEPSYGSHILDMATDPDTVNNYNYIQISSNVSGKQFPYYVCIGHPFTSIFSYYGFTQVNTNIVNSDLNLPSIVSVFANNSANQIIINSKISDDLEIIVTDLTGRSVLHESFISSCIINTEHLTRGLFLYQVRTQNRIIKNGKVLLN